MASNLNYLNMGREERPDYKWTNSITSEEVVIAAEKFLRKAEGKIRK